MGGRNITLHIAAQSRAQLRQRFGDAGAAAIVNNAATLLVFGGTRDPDDLAAYATLAGERDEDVATYDHTHGQTSTSIRLVPVLTAAQIAQLPAGRVMIVSRGMPVAIGKVQMAWRRRDVRRAAQRLQVADHALAVEPVEPIGEVVGVILPADDAAA
jgi:type IV secretory pathway TraG/TraD family ATPase VirD4